MNCKILNIKNEITKILTFPNLLKVTIIIIILSLNFIRTASIKAQTNDSLEKIELPKRTDSINNNVSIEKKYWTTMAEVLGTNAIVWVWSQSNDHTGVYKIGFNSIRRNFEEGFTWDDDGFLGNQFLHPYHGAAYYTAARANGFDFWEAAPYAVMGSLTWEFLMEDQRPSYNDIVNTPITGIILGEMSFRVAHLIIDNSLTGFDRVIRETAALIISPMNGFNRLIRGEMWSIKSNSEKEQSKLTFMTGVNLFNTFSENRNNFGVFGVQMDYGNKYSVENHLKPFDYFNFSTEFNIASSDLIFAIFASGVIWDDSFKMLSKSGVIGIYKEIDLISSIIYNFTATSITGQFISKDKVTEYLTLESSLAISAILIGGTNSEYSIEEKLNYNIGPGAGCKIGLNINIDSSIQILTHFRRYWLHTLSGPKSDEFIGITKIGIGYFIFSNFQLGSELLFYDRYGIYDIYPDINISNTSIRVFLKIF